VQQWVILQVVARILSGNALQIFEQLALELGTRMGLTMNAAHGADDEANSGHPSLLEV
jgi:hypothetical protein